MTILKNEACEDSYSNNQAANFIVFGQEFVFLFAFERESNISLSKKRKKERESNNINELLFFIFDKKVTETFRVKHKKIRSK